jgi:hypothetical protein
MVVTGMYKQHSLCYTNSSPSTADKSMLTGPFARIQCTKLSMHVLALTFMHLTEWSGMGIHLQLQ